MQGGTFRTGTYASELLLAQVKDLAWGGPFFQGSEALAQWLTVCCSNLCCALTELVLALEVLISVAASETISTPPAKQVPRDVDITPFVGISRSENI